MPLLLLDSDIEENDADLRGVTDRLYGGDQDHRIRQEILVGIGGVRAVRAYCALTGHPQPEVFHTNEGHAGSWAWSASASCAPARASRSTRRWRPCARARCSPRTPRCPRASTGSRSTSCRTTSATRHLLPGVRPTAILALGAEDNPSMFNMAHMGLRLAQRANGVSKLHGAVSRGMFGGLWDGFDADEVPIGSVTNGVHGPTWEAREITELLGEPDHPRRDEVSERQRALGSCATRCARGWSSEVRRRVREAWLQRGASPPELGWTEHVFDPDVLTVGFARRVPTYKRLTLMLRDQDRLRDAAAGPASGPCSSSSRASRTPPTTAARR